MLQTPIDGGPFCSFVVSKPSAESSTIGLYIYSAYEYSPTVLLTKEGVGRFVGKGIDCLALPIALLERHAITTSAQVGEVEWEVHRVESELLVDVMTNKDDQPTAFLAKMTKRLDRTASRLMLLEERSGFQVKLKANIELFAQETNFAAGFSGGNPLLQESTDVMRKFNLEIISQTIARLRSTVRISRLRCCATRLIRGPDNQADRASTRRSQC